MTKTIVISGINIVDGGAKSVFDDLLDSIVQSEYVTKYHFVILVSRKELFQKYINVFEIIEFPKSKKHWINRVYYEYFYFKKLSRRLKPYIWLSMHDITPNVVAEKKYVYCHNPSPFYNMSIKDIKYGWKYYLFSKFYKYLYKVNIKKNNAVIVQQQWMGKEFEKMYGVKNIIVAQPTIDNLPQIQTKVSKKQKTVFIYPSYPRIFKNFEFPCKVAKRIYESGKKDFVLLITLKGNENSYSKMLYKKYSKVPTIKFIGLLSRNDLFKEYGKADCLVFTSKLETWGMPISEFKQTGKSIIALNLPYAWETVGSYDNSIYVDNDDYKALMNAMINVINKKRFHNDDLYEQNSNYTLDYNWHQLLKTIFV